MRSDTTLPMMKVLHSILRRGSRLLRLHPTSHPFISGDTFRNVAHHIHDMDSNINPRLIREGDIVFVQSPRMMDFFTNINPQIKNGYVLITHNGDENITEQYLPLITDTVKHWFAQNCLITHPKITPLPIGLENKWYYLHGIPRYYKSLRAKPTQKVFKILYKFSVTTNPTVRGAALKVLKEHSLAETYDDWRESFSYLRTLQNFSFIASPEGNGHDCIRTWESMYLGTAPILKRSVMSEYFYSLGLPIILIEDWEDLTTWDPERLKSLYDTITPKLASRALWADYWIELINSKRHDK